jgi:methylmalonyl-CoA/ethylmalonyl-CoA epimerase
LPSLIFHHIGLGTATFDVAIAIYIDLGYELITSIDDHGLDVRIAFLRGQTGPYIEIVAPLGPNGPLKSLLSRRLLPSPYHTCYATDDVMATGIYLRDKGFIPLGEPRPAIAFGGAFIAYYYHSATGMLELVENPPMWSTDSPSTKQRNR